MTRVERAVVTGLHRDNIPEAAVTILCLSALAWAGGLIFNDKWMAGQQFEYVYRLPRAGWAVLFVLVAVLYLLSLWGPYRSVTLKVGCGVALTLMWSAWGTLIGAAYSQGGIPVPSLTFASLNALFAWLWAIERRHGVPQTLPPARVLRRVPS